MDQITYLPDDILVNVDRATMRVALESRVPLLDHRLVEFPAHVPERLKVHAGQGKWLLRQVLYRYLDSALFARRKQGFVVPLAEWLRGPLRPWADELLDPACLDQIGLLDTAPIRRAWNLHARGARNLQHSPWVVLMFQAWARSYGPVTA